MNLYEINSEIENILNNKDVQEFAEANGGEIPHELSEYLDNLDMQRDEKISNIAKFIINLKADEEAYKSQRKKFELWEKTARNKHESLKTWLQSNMKDGEKIKTSEFYISWTHRDVLEIESEEKIPSVYFETKAPVLSKKILLEEIKAGEEIPGVKVINKAYITIK